MTQDKCFITRSLVFILIDIVAIDVVNIDAIYRLLCSLALTSQFLRKLWYVITTKEQQTMFGSAATYVNIISRGIELPPVDVQVIVPMFTTFCSLLILLITTLHDNEFYNDDSSNSPVTLRYYLNFQIDGE